MRINDFTWNISKPSLFGRTIIFRNKATEVFFWWLIDVSFGVIQETKSIGATKHFRIGVWGDLKELISSSHYNYSPWASIATGYAKLRGPEKSKTRRSLAKSIQVFAYPTCPAIVLRVVTPDQVIPLFHVSYSQKYFNSTIVFFA